MSEAQQTATATKAPEQDIFDVLAEVKSTESTALALSTPTLLATSAESSIDPPTRPEWMTDEDAAKLEAGAAAYVAKIRENPGDIRIGEQLDNLGKAAKAHMLPHVQLFEKRLSGLMQSNKEGSPASTTLVELKTQLDLINPAVIRKQPIVNKILFGLIRTARRLPTVGEVVKRIQENQETVKSTITGLRRQLFAIGSSLEEDRDDLIKIYNGLYAGERLLERDIYVGHLMAREIEAFVNGMADGPEKDNVKEALANLVSHVNYLKREENANEQFFAATQVMVKLIRGQVRNINNISGLLERSVMANLALAVSAVELETSVKVTGELSEAIDTTFEDTGKRIKDTSVVLAEQRASAGVNFEKLERAIDHIEGAVQAQKEANDLIISRGGETFRRLDDLTKRVRETTRLGHQEIVGDKH